MTRDQIAALMVRHAERLGMAAPFGRSLLRGDVMLTDLAQQFFQSEPLAYEAWKRENAARQEGEIDLSRKAYSADLLRQSRDKGIHPWWACTDERIRQEWIEKIEGLT